MNKRKTGEKYEVIAAEQLTSRGYRILERNYRCPIGEIDLIAMDGDTLVFVEVKYRSYLDKGFPEEAVTYRKQQKISRVAGWYIADYRYVQEIPFRFDVVALLPGIIRIYKNAFPFRG